jgi:predicted RNA-binding Zn-ribbon protein involved in translation (DUF1610 family)
MANKRRYMETWEMYCVDTKCFGNAMSIDPDANLSHRHCPICGKPMRNRRHLAPSPPRQP